MKKSQSPARVVGALLKRHAADADLLEAVLTYSGKVAPQRFVRGVRNIDVEEDVLLLKRQVDEILREHPISRGIKTLYFGLFEAVYDEKEGSVAGFYISGVKRFDPRNLDTLCRPAYFPDNRYLRSALLDYVVRSAISARVSRVKDALASNCLLGFSAYLVRRVTRDIKWKRGVATGFDDGDVVRVSEE